MNQIKSINSVTGHNSLGAAIGQRTYHRTIARPLTSRARVVDVSTCYTIEKIGATLGHADLRETMIDDGLLMADGMPYQHYRDCEYLTVVMSDAGTSEVLVLPEGQVWLARRYPATKKARKHARRSALQ
ncbi:phage antirepressor KilAC domain-containing protein (plasmid) [Burkholderia vietnamiensis]|uniref:Uncharacterized protein n=1 Tax=Burkholderia vietnamiensis (strain G4 / LMG 22486) TaxID=269482 RepID=A4JWC8_BURVG|nr:hypothetical protein Bcep1808_7711 [Burkholderia vietnamiensis G4]MCB4349756.1 phage antirepressor KilAC domain-containing protein [Burkholderia vietnamiensis]